MLLDVGTLLTLLALTRLVAPEPPSGPVETAPRAAPSESDPESLLLPIVFIPSANPTGVPTPGNDLRDPFRARLLQTRASAPTRRSDARPKARNDLRDPFAHRPNRRSVTTPSDLRDPFDGSEDGRDDGRDDQSPACPDTGGVPIQRPSSVEPRCAHASRRVVLARR